MIPGLHRSSERTDAQREPLMAATRHSTTRSTGFTPRHCSPWFCLLVFVLLLDAGPLLGQQSTSTGGTTSNREDSQRSAERDRLWNEAQQLRGAGKLVDAAETGERMLAIERKWLGADHVDIVVSLEWLADVYERAENWNAAEVKRKDAFAWREKHRGQDHWETVNARLALENVAIQRKLSADQRAELATAQTAAQEMARFHAAGRYADAVPSAQHALAIRTKLLGENHRDTATSMNELAETYRMAGDLAQAIRLHEQALAVRKAVVGEKHPDTAFSLNNCAMSYYSQGDYARAVPLYEQALAIIRQAQGEKNVNAALIINNLAELYRTRGDYARARPLYEQALAIHKEVLGEKHSNTALSLNNLAVLFQTQGEYARAAALQEQALAIYKEVSGAKHPNTALSLCNLGVLYQAQGNYARAESSYKESLAIYQATLGDKHTSTAATMCCLAELYRVKGDYPLAVGLHEQALAIRKQVLGENHFETAQSINFLAMAYYAQGNYSRALPLFEKALSIVKASLGEKHPSTAESLSNLAEFYREHGDYARAKPLYEQALAIFREVFGEKHVGTALCLNNLALLCQTQGDYARAESLHEQALAIYKELFGEKHPDTALCINNLALLYQMQGDYARAAPLCEQVVAIYKEVMGEKHVHTALSLNNLGELYRAQGDYARARPLFEQAVAIYKEVLGEKHPSTALSINNLAILYQTQGDYSRAASLSEQVLAIYKEVMGEKHINTALSLNNLAEIYRSQGNPQRALPLFEQALAIYEEVLGEKHPSTALSLNNLAMCYQMQGDYDRALALNTRALAIYKEVLGEKHPSTALTLNNLAEVHKAQGDFAHAIAMLEQALAINKAALGDKHPSTALNLNNLAVYHELQGDFPRAVPLFEQALAIMSDHLEASAMVLTEQQQLTYRRHLRWYLDGYLSSILQTEADGASAYRAVLGWKGATIVRQRAARIAADSPELAPLFADLQSTTRNWAALFSAKSDNSADLQQRLADLTAKKDKLEADLSRKSSAFLAATKKITLEDFVASLPADAALVDYLEFLYSEPSKTKTGQLDWRRSMLAFVVRPGEPVKMFNLGEVAPVTEAIDTWRLGYGMSSDAQQAGKRLRELIWQPLLPAIGDAKLVFISPDGALGRLPFAALPGEKVGSYLLEDHRLALVPVPQLLPALVDDSGRKQLAKELLLVGGVDYDHQSTAAPPPTALASAGPWRPWHQRPEELVRAQTPNGRWNFLKGSEAEVAFIKDLYQRSTQRPRIAEQIVELRGPAATKAQFCALAPQCYILHISTHGFFATPAAQSALAAAPVDQRKDPGNSFDGRFEAVHGFSPGLLSGLVLAGANDPSAPPTDSTQQIPDDGYLTADEISFLPLGGAQLVVLSACETGLGEVAGGEGLLGIQRAFQVAGARTTIATLWKVNDQATRRIMEEFYRNYLDKEKQLSTLDALREAQLWALRNPDLVPRGADAPPTEANHSHLSPEFWAAFTLSGDWR
jgi:tetratricopeptide (TPR) repeat protein/CHAT domain-containing protein